MIMNALKKLSYFLLAGALFTACTNEPELQTTDVGPEMEVLSVSEAAYFGGMIKFEVSMNDRLPLSTLKGQLFFDEEMVAEEVIRTKENGTYEGEIIVPFYKDIENGDAVLKLVGQNTYFGLTTIEQVVAVERPDPDKIYFVMGSEEIEMPRVDTYQYAVTQEFPQKPKGYFRTGELDEEGTIATFGWANGQVAYDSTEAIPLSNSVAGEFTVSFNLKTFEAAPFVKLLFNGVEMEMVTESTYQTVAALTQGEAYELEGLGDLSEGWTIDPDWFTLNAEGKLVAQPITGTYMVVVDTDKCAVTAYVWDTAENKAGKFDPATGKSALWLVGEGLGKPDMNGQPGWTPEKGLCLSPVAEGIYQITAIAGLSMKADGINFKFFGQNDGWGPVELKGDVLSSDSDLIIVGTGATADGGNGVDSGNVQLQEGKSFEMGGIYVFTVTWADGKGVLTVTKNGEAELPKAELKINGEELTLVDGHYEVDLELTQGETLTLTGVEGFTPAWINPDFFKPLSANSVSLVPVAGHYRIILDPVALTIDGLVLNAAGDALATLNDEGHGAVYFIGYGIGSPAACNEPGWTTEKGVCVPEAAPGIYKMVAQAGQEKSTTLGQRFRVSGWSGKFFKSRGWTDLGRFTLTAGSEAFFKITDGGNIEMADGATLEEGATYELTLDVTQGNDKPVITFVKK